MKFLQLNSIQLKLFDVLKSSEEVKFHGPLSRCQSVPVHRHAETTLYVVNNGAAVYENGSAKDLQVLSSNHDFNAVLVDNNEPHGWISLMADTLIEHVFGGKNVGSVISVKM